MSTEQKINKESKVSKSSEQEEEINIADILQLIWSNRYSKAFLFKHSY